jgi:hypothetical protein
LVKDLKTVTVIDHSARFLDSNHDHSIDQFASIALPLIRLQLMLEQLKRRLIPAAEVSTEVLPSVRRSIRALVVCPTTKLYQNHPHVHPKSRINFERKVNNVHKFVTAVNCSLASTSKSCTIEDCVQPPNESMLDLKLESTRAKACLSYRKPW